MTPALILYKPDPADDVLLTSLWLSQHEDPEFLETFGAYDCLSDFLVGFRDPRALLYSADEQGVWFAAPVRPMMSGCLLSLWVRGDRRRGKATLALILQTLSQLLEIYPVILVLTRRKELLAPYIKLGYKVMGQVPHLYKGESAWLAWLDRDGFAARSVKWTHRAETSRKKAALV